MIKKQQGILQDGLLKKYFINMEHLYLARDSQGTLTLFSQEPRRREYVYNEGTSYEIRISG